VIFVVERRRNLSWSAVPIGALAVLLGAWAFFVPLVGPYFDFGFTTDDAWTFSRETWILSIGPGAAAMLAGVVMLAPLRIPAWLGSSLAALSAAWLLVGPSLYPAFSAGELVPIAAGEWKTAFLWIGYFYGVGALLLFLTALAQGLTAASRTIVRDERVLGPVEPVPEKYEDRPVYERTRAIP
jgi:hypothetical protein